MSGWLKGTVKEVLSGDTIVIAAPSKNNVPPPEKRVSLSSLVAPKLGRRDGSTVDEPHAFASKEFLRRLLIGESCVFRIDYKIDAANREFGSVFLGEQNVAVSIVANGWAKVRQGGSQQSPFYEELVQAQETAKSKRIGMHADDPQIVAASARDADEEDPAMLLKKFGKGGEVKAIVDGVISGSMIRVTLMPSRKSHVVLVTGVQCPSMRGPSGTGAVSAERVALGVDGAPEPEPFAREARWLCESLCLNRDVVLVLNGVSQHGALIAQVQYPAIRNGGKKASADATADLGETLMSSGYARSAEWSLNMIGSGAFKLREAERAARAARRGQWRDHVANPSNVQNQKRFQGTVVEIVSGDCLVIIDNSGAEHRVTLSSIRAPRPASRDRPAEPYGTEAKEFLRSRLIGKTVSVEMEYSKTIPLGVQSKEERTVDFGTVFVGGSDINGAKTAKGIEDGGSSGLANVAELLLIRGLASTVKHRADDERSAYFERLFVAEENGKSSKKGIHSGKEAPITRINDLSAPGSAAKARQHLPFLQRAGTVSAIVDYVMSGSRLKLFVPKQSVAIAFSPSGVQCPRKGEEFSDEALAFTRKRFMQRSVEIHVEAVDKLGTFLGYITVGNDRNKLDLSVALLRAGLAKVHGSSNVGIELVQAEEIARNDKLGLWGKESSESSESPKMEDVVQFKRERTRVTITEMCDANSFYVQHADDARAQWIADQIQDMKCELESSAVVAGSMGVFRPGTQVLAKFAPDRTWYRAKITKSDSRDPINPKYDVQFIDFGNRDAGLTQSDVRPMPASLAVVPAQAHLATLAFVHAPIELREDLNYIVMDRISELTDGGKKVLGGYKEAISRTQDGSSVIMHLTLFPGEISDVAESISGELAMDGLVKCVKDIPQDSDGRAVFDALQSLERDARRRHLGIFEYGDVDDDEDM